MASHMEQLHHAAATADEHAQHCVVPLLGIAPYGGGGGSADSTCAVLLYPDRTVGDLVRSEASAQRAGLNLPVWVRTPAHKRPAPPGPPVAPAPLPLAGLCTPL